MKNATMATDSANNATDCPKMTIKQAIEIGHASDVLEKAYKLVLEAYSLISHDEVARKYLHLSATVSWAGWARKLITETYDAEFNNDGRDIYHLRAFDGLGLQYPVCVSDGSAETDGSCGNENGKKVSP